jgi:hypothetical protein
MIKREIYKMDMGRDFVKLRVGKVNGFLKEVFKRKNTDEILTS